MTAQEIVQELGLSGMKVETFREVFESEKPLMTQALINYSTLLSMPLDLGLFYKLSSDEMYCCVNFPGMRYSKEPQTNEDFINNCRQAGIGLTWE